MFFCSLHTIIIIYFTTLNSPVEVGGSVKPDVEDNTYVDVVDFNRDIVSG